MTMESLVLSLRRFLELSMEHSKQLCLKQRYAAFSNPCILEFLLHLCSWQEPSRTRLSSYIVSSTLFDPNIFKHHKILFVTIVKPMNFSFQKSSIPCFQVYFYPRFFPLFTPLPTLMLKARIGNVFWYTSTLFHTGFSWHYCLCQAMDRDLPN